jgi:ribosomal protein S18 acetylase RimI-like enzyme
MPLEGAALEAADDLNKLIHLSWIQERTEGMQVFFEDDLVIVDSGLATDTFNVVCRSRLSSAGCSARIRSVLRHFRSTSRPFTWWVGPADRPADLGRALLEEGFRATGTEPGMALNLERLTAVPETPREFHIERARTEASVRKFGELIASLAYPLDHTVAAFYARSAPAVLDPESPVWLYVGYLGDEPVATAELTVGGGIVGLYNITTAAAHRKKGIGTAMTVRPLRDARESGYPAAVLQASEEGFPIYSRIGFEVTGSFTEYHPA